MALSALPKFVQQTTYAMIMPFTNWIERLDKEIRPYFPGIKPIHHAEKHKADLLLQKLDKGYYPVLSREGWEIHQKYLKDNPSEAKKQTCIIKVMQAVSLTIGGGGAYKIQEYFLKVRGLEESRVGLFTNVVISFMSAAKCCQLASDHIRKGLMIGLELEERFKVWKEQFYAVDARTIVRTYEEKDEILSGFQCSFSSDLIVHASYSPSGLWELNQLLEARAEKKEGDYVRPEEVKECYATTMIVHKRIIFLYEKALASLKMSDATKETAQFRRRIDNAKQIADTALATGLREDSNWITALVRQGRISSTENREAMALTDELYTKKDFSKEEIWNEEWKGKLANRFKRLFYEYPVRALNLFQ